MKKRKKGQVWIESVIYTLIAFALIGAVLSFVKPKIDELQDKSILDQSVIMLQGVDNTIFEIVQKGVGNKRKVGIGLKKGFLTIDGESDQIIFQMDSAVEYSEPGANISKGGVQSNTVQLGEFNKVTLKIDYSEKYDLTLNGEDVKKIISSAPTDYNMYITNNGGDLINIDIEIE